MKEARKWMLVLSICVVGILLAGNGNVYANTRSPFLEQQVVYVDTLHGDDTNSGGCPDQALASIRQALRGGADQVLIYPGVYYEHLEMGSRSVELKGVVGPEGAPVIEGGFFPAVAWKEDETADPNARPQLIMQNLIIRRSPVGILVLSGFPELKNLTIVECGLGVLGVPLTGHGPSLLDSSILWNNSFSVIGGGFPSYSSTERPFRTSRGNIFLNPKFADAEGGDYHLRSRAGRYQPALDQWVTDEETSPCIDTGRPTLELGEEPVPNGSRINMGAYGGTAYASMSEGRRPELKIGRRQGRFTRSGGTIEWEFTVDVEALFGDIVKVRFLVDNEIVAVDEDSTDGWQVTWAGEGTGSFLFFAIAEDTGGLEGVSDSIIIQASDSVFPQ